jgi:hypothetical protein
VNASLAWVEIILFAGRLLLAVEKPLAISLKRSEAAPDSAQQAMSAKSQCQEPSQPPTKFSAVEVGRVALIPKADMCIAQAHVCYGPIADIDWREIDA